jgi:hypothetical protein
MSSLPTRLPDIALNRARAIWVLSQLGFRGNVTASTFTEYIKSLRKLGIPFATGDIGLARRGQGNYSYCHLMELALVLTLRVYHVVPDPLLARVVRYRRNLYRKYRNAYAQRCTGTGAPIIVQTEGSAAFPMRGVFIDLQIDYSGGKLVNFGPPKSLSPFDAFLLFAKGDVAARSLVPFNLSILAEKVVEHSLKAPIIRRGPRPRTT